MPGLAQRRMDARLAQIYEWGRARHPRISIELTALKAHLECCADLEDEGLQPARAGDLYLVCAALAGQPAAVAALQAECWPIAARYLRPFQATGALMTELSQELWEALLVGPPGGAPKLLGYSGRGPLGAFAAIVAQRLALMGLRRHEVQARATKRAHAEQEAIVGDTELAFVKRRYRGAFERAIREAIASLADRDRLTLRLYFVDGVGLERLARMYDVTASTISRRLAKVRSLVAARTRELLGERLGLTAGDVDSLWNVLASQIDLSVSSLLRHGQGSDS